MEEKKLNLYKLEVIEVVKESISLYKNNYSLLLKISILSFSISIFNTALSYIRAVLGTSILYYIITLFDLVISLPIIYFQARLTVTMYICISNCYSEKLPTFRKAFEKAKESIWSYIGVSILFGLIVLPFILVGWLIFTYIKVMLVKYLLLLIAAIPLIYLGTIYEFAPLASVLEERKTSYFKLSKRLVQRNFWRIAIFMISIGGITSLPSLFTSSLNPWFKSLSILNQNAIKVARDLLFVFVTPAVTSIIVVLYLTFRKKVVYKQ